MYRILTIVMCEQEGMSTLFPPPWLSFLLVVLFGSTSWMGTNSVWMELPLLTATLPEGWSLPSYLAIIVQIACIGPLVYGFVHKCCYKLPSHILIIVALLLAILCQSCLALSWSRTAKIFNGTYSIHLYMFLFGLALVNALSNVLFLPFMSQYHPTLLTAYFVGMGLSSLVPSLLSIVQGTSNFECIGGQPKFEPPRFGVSTYEWVIVVWTVVATAAFCVLLKTEDRQATKTIFDDYSKKDKRRANNKNGMQEAATEKSPLNTSREVEARESGVVNATQQNEEHTEKYHHTTSGHIVILLLTALVNAQMNGVIPSVHSYAALPYSQTVYHLGLTVSNIVSPIASFLPLLYSTKSLPSLGALTAMSTGTTAFILYLGLLSPGYFINESIGSAFSVGSVVVAAGLHSYLRTVFASHMRDSGHHSESWLFWCGVFIQIGSFIGSAVMFPLVNFTTLFTAAPMCR